MDRLGLSQVFISHIHNVIENPYFYKIYKYSVSPGFAKQIMPILFFLRYNGSLALEMLYT
jgi:hypothetical protein